MIHEHLDIPFVTTVLSVAVTVTAVDIEDDDRIVAVCRRGHDQLRVALLELPMPDPRPEGAEWVDAYRHWARPRCSGRPIEAGSTGPRSRPDPYPSGRRAARPRVSPAVMHDDSLRPLNSVAPPAAVRHVQTSSTLAG